MLYENYQKKIKKIAWVISVFVKILPIILISIAAISVITITLVAAKGSVGSVNCPDEIIYGEKIECSAFGLLSEVDFEYSSDGGTIWSPDAPHEVGNYLVRAVGKTSFGGNRYSVTKPFAIVPKELSVEAASTVVYGEIPKVSAPLLPGESITCDAVIYGDALALNTTVTPNVADGHTKIFDANGKDITFCYSLQGATTNIAVTPRPVGITVEDYTATYNGQDVVFNKYEVTEGSMMPLDNIRATFDGKLLEVGEVSNKAEFKVSRAIGETEIDITYLYSFNIRQGSISVDYRPLVLETYSYGATYSGEGISWKEYGVLESTPLAEGHKIVDVKFQSFVDYKEGGYDNLITFKIVDEHEQEVTHNYSVNIIEGKIDVYKRPISVKPADTTSEYNGLVQYFNAPEVIIDGSENCLNVANGETFEILTSTPFENVMLDSETGDVISGKNEILSYRIYRNGDESKTDISHNYIVTTVEGDVTITKKPLKVTTYDGVWTYDGLEHSVLDGRDGRGEVLISVEGLVFNSGLGIIHEYFVEECSSILDFADYPLDIVSRNVENTVKITVQGYDVTDKYVDKTDNYEIDYGTPGTLTLNKRAYTIKTGSDMWIYDGEEHYYIGKDPLGQETVKVENLAAGHDFSIVDNSWAKVYDFAGADPDVTSLEVSNTLDINIWYKDSEGNDVDATCNYIISEESEYGTLTLLKRPLKVKPKNAVSRYNGLTQYFKTPEILDTVDVEIPAFTGSYIIAYYFDVAVGETFEILTSTPFENVMLDSETGEVISGKNEILSYRIYRNVDESKTDISYNYVVTTEEGDVTITKKPLQVTTNDGEWTYDGLEHSVYDSIDDLLGVEGLVEDIEHGIIHSYSIESYSKVKDFSEYGYSSITSYSIDNTVVITVFAVEGEITVDKTYNYEIDYGTPGKLTLKKRPFVLTTGSYEWTYDGEEHYYIGLDEHGEETVKVGNLIAGHNFNIVDNSWAKVYDFYGVDSGVTSLEVSNTLDINIWYKDSEGNNVDVTYNYIVSEESAYGTLTLHKRPISVLPAYAESEYNGLPQYFKTPNIFSGSLAENEMFEILDSTEFENVMLDPVTGKVISGKNEILSYTIYKDGDSSKTDISYNYIVTTVDGEVTITKKPLKVTTHNGEWIYDGLEHSAKDNTDTLVTVEGLVANIEEGVIHTFEIDEYSSVKDFSKYGYSSITSYSIDNTVVITVFAVEGEITVDKTDNYEIEYDDNYGKLTLKKRQISVKPLDGSAVYNGLPQYFKTPNIFSGSLAENEMFEILDSTEFENVMLDADGKVISGKNYILSYKIYKDGDSSNDISYNYIVTTEKGNVTITKKPLKVTTHDGEWFYDGKVHSVYDSIDELLTIEGLVEYSDLGIIHTYNIVDYSKVKDFSDYRSPTVTFYSIDNTVKITVSYGVEDKTANYEIDYGTPGKLTLKKRTISVKPKTSTAEYNGLPQYFKTPEILVDLSAGKLDLAEGEVFEILTSTTFENVMLDADGKVISGKNYILSYKIYKDGDLSKADISYNYIVDTNVGDVTITKKPLRVTTYNGEWIYDGIEHSVYDSIDELLAIEGLVEYPDLGIIHTYNIVDYSKVKDFSDYRSPTVTFYSIDNTVKITVSYGVEDKTANYEIDYGTPGTLTLHKRPIKVQLKDAESEYNGLPQYFKAFNVLVDRSAGQLDLVGGEKFEVLTSTEFENVMLDPVTGKVISGKNEILSYRIYKNGDSLKTDISYNYIVTRVEGEVTITKKPLKVTTYDGEWTYDGLEHSARDIADEYGNNLLSVEGLVEYIDRGIIHSFDIVEYSSVKDFSDYRSPTVTSYSIDNTVKIMIFFGGEDKTDNYEIEYDDNYGKLTLKKRQISVKPLDGSAVYNGLPQYFKTPNIFSGSLAENEMFEILDSTEFENVMLDADGKVISGKNYILSYKIYKDGDSSKTDISYNYIVDTNVGYVTITKKPLTVTTHNGEWTYDDRVHSVHDITDENGNKLLTIVGLVSYDDLGIHHAYKIVECSSVYDFSDYRSPTVTFYSIDNTVKITVSYGGEDKTYNYEIDYGTPGTLTLKKRNITIKTENNHSTVYDARPHSFKGFSISNTAENEGLVSGQKFIVYTSTSITNVDVPVDNEFFEYAICYAGDPTETDLKYNYIVSFDCQTIKLLPRPLTIKTESAEKEYDGAPLSKNEDADWSLTSGTLVKDEPYGLHELTVIFDEEAQQTIPGQVLNTFTWSIVDKLSGQDVSGNYIVTPDNGTLTVERVHIMLIVDGDTVTYDALEHRARLIAYNKRRDLSMSVIEFTYGITNVGTIGIEDLRDKLDEHLFIRVAKDVDGDGVFELEIPKEYCDFEINPAGNAYAVKVNPKVIELTVDDVSRAYNGEPLTADKYTISKQVGAWIEGHYINDEELIIEGSVVGEHNKAVSAVASIVRDSVHIYDAEGVEVTGNYSITLINGVLTVYPSEGDVGK